MYNVYHIGTAYFIYDLIANKKIKKIDKLHHIFTIVCIVLINLIYKRDSKKVKKIKNILHVLFSLLEINTIALRLYVNSDKYKNFFIITWIYRILALVIYSSFNVKMFLKKKDKMYIPLIISSLFYSYYYNNLWHRIKNKKRNLSKKKIKSKFIDPIS